MAQDNGSVEFLPGFTNFMGSKPGTVLQNDDYVLTFDGVLLNGKKSAIVSQGFESCYDWSDVMSMLIDSLHKFEDIDGAEEFATEDLTTYLMTYSGWGLLSTLLPRKQHVKFNRKLREIKENWPVNENYSEEACWATLFLQTETSLESIIPEFEVTISEGDFGADLGRTKWFEIRFVSTWNLTVKFSVEKKKRWTSSLVNVAAAAVAKNLEDGDHVNVVDQVLKLEIPATLRSPVEKMRRDQRWVASSRSLRKSLHL